MIKNGLLFVVAMVAGVCACSGPDGSSGSTSSSGAGGSDTSTSSSGSGGAAGSSSSTSSSGSGGAGGAGACLPGDVDYSMCTGSTFFPDGSCAKGVCAMGSVATQVFAEWAKQAQSASGLMDAAFWDRVLVSKVETSGNFIRIEVVLVIDWARSREAFSIDTSGFSPVPTAMEIQKAVSLVNFGFKWSAFGGITQIAPASKVREAFAACYCNVNADWCHIRMRNGSPGFLGVDGIAVIDMAANQCKDALIDIETGLGNLCIDTPCEIN